MSEIELKFVTDEAGIAALSRRLKDEGLAGALPRPRTLISVYHDSADQRLRRAAIALRLRKDGNRWVQTVKRRAQLAGGLSRVEEIEVPAPGGRLDIGAFPEQARDAVLAALDGAETAPVCETAMRRVAAEIALPEGRVEIALDSGEIRANGAAVPFHEAELELLSGELGMLYDLAGRLMPEGGLRFSTLTKAARGYMLAETGRIAPPLAPRNAETVPLDPEQTAETAARDVLHECFAQVAANVAVVLDEDEPEGPHQLRVGLRRLRSALSVFRPVVGCPALAALADEAGWLGREVGHLRDLDVVATEILAPAAAAHPGEPGFPALRAAIEARREGVRDGLRAVLRGARCQGFLLELARAIETRAWLTGADYDQTERLAQPVAAMAGAALDTRWKKVAKRAKGIDGLDTEARHALRKELKKLRYAVEFLGPLHAPKAVKRFLRRMKDLQTVFGTLNDVTMAEAMLLGPEAPAARDPDAQRAVGRLLGEGAVQARDDWSHARTLWRELKHEGPFWR